MQQLAVLLDVVRLLAASIGAGDGSGFGCPQLHSPALLLSTPQVKTITSLSLAALAEASSPYGIESFDDVLEPLWRGIRSLRGKVLAAFLKCIGHIIPLMDAEHAFYYTREVMVVLKREFQTPDEEMKKIVLKVCFHKIISHGRDVLHS